jgi:hypothetical protein
VSRRIRAPQQFQNCAIPIERNPDCDSVVTYRR